MAEYRDLLTPSPTVSSIFDVRYALAKEDGISTDVTNLRNEMLSAKASEACCNTETIHLHNIEDLITFS